MLNGDNIFQHVKKVRHFSRLSMGKVPVLCCIEAWIRRQVVRYHNECPSGKLGLDGDEEMDILDLKCPPEKSEELRDGERVLPGYHMHKEHWISIVLKQIESLDEIEDLIEESFELSK